MKINGLVRVMQSCIGLLLNTKCAISMFSFCALGTNYGGHILFKKHKGYNGELYDSKAEAVASFRFAELGCVPCKTKFTQSFIDADGKEFRAIPDFYHPKAEIYIEFKCRKLNSVTTQETSKNALQGRRRYRQGEPWRIDYLNCGWNHSKASKSIVQETLTPQRYIVVFDDPPSDVEACAYLRAGIVFCPMSALPSYLAYARFIKIGLKVSFQLHYYDEQEGITTLSLGKHAALSIESGQDCLAS